MRILMVLAYGEQLDYTDKIKFLPRLGDDVFMTEVFQYRKVTKVVHDYHDGEIKIYLAERAE